MVFGTWGLVHMLFKNEIVRYLISADNRHVNSFFQNKMRNKQVGSVYKAVFQLWNLSELSLFVWFLGIYRWTDEGVVPTVCYATLPWLLVATKRHVWFSGGTARFQVAAVSSGCDASLHPLLTDLHSKQSPGWSYRQQRIHSTHHGGCCVYGFIKLRFLSIQNKDMWK